MILVAFVFIFLAVKYDFEPMLLIPIGVGIIVGNIPFIQDSYEFTLQEALAALSKIEIQGNLTFDLTEAQKFFVGLYSGMAADAEMTGQQALDHFHSMSPEQLSAEAIILSDADSGGRAARPLLSRSVWNLVRRPVC